MKTNELYWHFTNAPWCYCSDSRGLDISYSVILKLKELSVSKMNPGFGGVLLGSSGSRDASVTGITSDLRELFVTDEDYCGMWFLGPAPDTVYHPMHRLRCDFDLWKDKGIVIISIGSDPEAPGWLTACMIEEEWEGLVDMVLDYDDWPDRTLPDDFHIRWSEGLVKSKRTSIK